MKLIQKLNCLLIKLTLKKRSPNSRVTQFKVRTGSTDQTASDFDFFVEDSNLKMKAQKNKCRNLFMRLVSIGDNRGEEPKQNLNNYRS